MWLVNGVGCGGMGFGFCFVVEGLLGLLWVGREGVGAVFFLKKVLYVRYFLYLCIAIE